MINLERFISDYPTVDNDGDPYGVEISNSILEPIAYKGDTVVLSKTIKPYLGCLAYVFLNGSYHVLVINQINDNFYLSPINKKFKGFKVSQFDDFQILGVVDKVLANIRLEGLELDVCACEEDRRFPFFQLN